ncbi:MAG TPA: NAD(P)-binding domain-containing protein, partial [Gemmatimonadales bacterium]|nr:NAD(P)-binding domain-containing protein [Gemmatimonadales bacterium]
MTAVGVLGGGSWGTTLADLLARKGLSVRIWAYEAEVVESINRQQENTLFLPGCRLAKGLRAYADPVETVQGADVILSASPSHVVREVVKRVVGSVLEGTLVVSATKGLEPGSLLLMSEVLEQILPGARVVALSGPSFALEVFQEQPTAVVAAAREWRTAEDAQAVFAAPRFRVYSNQDVTGVE